MADADRRFARSRPAGAGSMGQTADALALWTELLARVPERCAVTERCMSAVQDARARGARAAETARERVRRSQALLEWVRSRRRGDPRATGDARA
jgi:hypothetical protein